MSLLNPANWLKRWRRRGPQELSPDVVIQAYQRGRFPIVSPNTQRISWESPDPRGVMPVQDFVIPKRDARRVRQRPFEIRVDHAFEAVIRGCADTGPRREQTWIDERVIQAYVGLHARGIAHSVEAWLGEELVGGLYGVHLGAVFFGESMFSAAERGGTHSSKICFIDLMERLRRAGFVLHDMQYWTPHLAQFGCTTLRRAEFLRDLERGLSLEAAWISDGVPAGAKEE